MTSTTSLLILLIMLQVAFMICLIVLAVNLAFFRQRIEVSRKRKATHTCESCVPRKDKTSDYCNALKCDLPNVSDLLGCGYYEKDETDY